jgi:3-dehydroquinate dehydratase
MSGTFPTLRAEANNSRGTYTPPDLFAGESQIVTNRALVLSGQNLARFTVVALNANGKLVAHDPTATVAVSGGASGQTAPAPQSRIAGVLIDAVNASAGDVSAAYYSEGVFNHAALTWHASLDTLEKRRNACVGTKIDVAGLL